MADIALNIVSNISGATEQIEEFTASIKKATSAVSQSGRAASKAGSEISGMSKGLFSLRKSTNSAAGAFSKMVKSLGRIAFYRAIRTAIRYVTDGFKEGLQAAYNWSKTQGGANAKLAGAMDALSAAAGRMKLQLGAAFGGLITAITPILIQIINLVTAAADAVTRFFAVLNGSGYYKRAVGGLDDIGNAAGGAGKKIKGLLASWDELNVIGKESGGGGGGSSATDYSGAYEWAEAESDWANLFKAGDFFGIGAKIGDALGNISLKITEFLKKPEIQNFGRNLANALNGSVSNPENWENFGEAVGTAISTLVKNIADFFNTVSWDDVKIAIKAFWEGFKQALYDNTNLDENLSAIEANWKLIKAWFADLPAQMENFGIKAINGLKSGIESGLNELIKKWNESSLIKLLGWEIEPVHFNLIPEIPEEELNKNWNKAKQEIEEAANSNPANAEVTVRPTPGGQLPVTEIVQGAKQVGQGVASVDVGVKASVDAPLDPTNLFTTNGGVITNPTGGITLGLGILPRVTGTIELKSAFTNQGGVTQDNNGLGMPIRIKPEVDGTVDVNVGLKKDGWTYVSEWVKEYPGTIVSKEVSLLRSGWTYISEWVKEYPGTIVSKEVSLLRSGWTYISEWVKKYPGTIVSKEVSLLRSGWTYVSEWVKEYPGTPVSVPVGINATAGTKIKSTDLVDSQTVKINAELSNAEAFTKALKEALKVKVDLKAIINDKTSTIGTIKSYTMAQGGIGGILDMPGQLFVAREAGPELVGTMGGHNAVANNDQIVAGIQSGVAQANAEQNELLRQQNSILMQLLNKDLTITPSVAFGQVVARSTAMYGRA